MYGNSTVRQIAARTGMLIAAVFVVTVLLAAMPGHRAPLVAAEGQQENAQQPAPQGMDHSRMAGMEHTVEQANEKAAMQDMSMGHMHGMNAHMTMTALHKSNQSDTERANGIVAQLKAGMEKYRDYHVALNNGFRIFLPNVPQPEYHFTSYSNGFLQAIEFDPSRPTSLLYRKTDTGYELVGAMYTMPKRATEDQLNERVPLSVAQWHLHTNLCMPPKDQAKTADWTKFGLHGSISTEAACQAAGGRFRPSIFGWMVHVYPYEEAPEKIFALNHRD